MRTYVTARPGGIVHRALKKGAVGYATKCAVVVPPAAIHATVRYIHGFPQTRDGALCLECFQEYVPKKGRNNG